MASRFFPGYGGSFPPPNVSSSLFFKASQRAFEGKTSLFSGPRLFFPLAAFLLLSVSKCLLGMAGYENAKD